MNLRIAATVIATLAAGAAQAHVSDAHGVAHATQHLWLVLALVPSLLLLRPLAQRLLHRRKH